MNKVWQLNMYEQGKADFWDYWVAVSLESSSILTAFNEIKKSGLSPDTDADITENLIAAYIYDAVDKNRHKLDIKPIKSLITQIGVKEFSSSTWNRVVSRECLMLLKNVLFKKQPKTYQKCKVIVESAL